MYGRRLLHTMKASRENERTNKQTNKHATLYDTSIYDRQTNELWYIRHQSFLLLAHKRAGTYVELCNPELKKGRLIS